MPTGTRLKQLLAGLCLAACAFAITGASTVNGSTASRVRPVERPERDLLLLALRLDQVDLDVVLTAYPSGDATLVPLGALAQALDIALQVETVRGVAHGFVLDERRAFRLAATSDTVWVDGKPRPFDGSGVEWHLDDVYVDSRLLTKWLPLELVVDRRASTLLVRPREPLSLQLRLARQIGDERFLREASQAIGGDGVQAPYRPWSWPSTDQSLYAYRRGSSSGSTGGFQYFTRFAGDLLYLETHGIVAGDDRDPMRDLRLSMGRRSPDPVLLGQLGAREIMAGDVLDPGLDLVSLASTGRGALLSSFPLYDELEYDRQTLRGDLPPGWDVELYRNDALIGYGQSGAGGVYEFADVPLLYGLNVIRLQFYGPQGQTRTEVRTLNLGRSLTPPGQTDYRLVAQTLADQTTRSHAEVSAGLTRQLSVTARWASLELADGARLYDGMGLRMGWDRWFVKTDAMLDDARGSVVQAAFATRLGPLGVWAQHARLHGFQSEVFQPTFGTIVARTGSRLDLEMRPNSRLRLPTSLEWRDDRLANGSVDDLVHLVSIATRGIGISNRLQGRFVRLEGVPTSVERRGTLLIHRGLRRLSLRGTMEYGFERGAELRDIGLTAETERFGPLLAAEIRRTVQPQETRGQISFTRESGPLGIVLRSDVGTLGGAGVSLLVSTSFDRDPRTRRWHLDGRPGSETGTVSAQVFLDDNANGRRDAGEATLEGVRLRTNPGGTETRTDSNGVAFITGLPSGYRSDLELVASSLEDPLRIPQRRDVTILPRAGTTALVDFPVVVCGEVAGTVFIRRAGVTCPQAGAKLELVAEADGRVVKRARSAFDGYYDIAAIPPGRYQLRATPAGPPRHDVAPAARPVEIGPGGPILEPFDLMLVGASPQIAGEGER